MFNFIVYSDTTYETASSYISVDELKTIVIGSIFVSYPSIDTADTAAIENTLINATQVLDSMFNYVGYKQDVNQRLEFPRNFEVPVLTISDDIKLAVAYIAGVIDQGKIDSIVSPVSGSIVKREKADVLETEYFEGSQSKATPFLQNPFLENTLKDYLTATGFRVATLTRTL